MYVDSPYSPISKAKMQSFLPLMNYLKTLQLKEKFSVFSELDLQELLNVFSLPGGHIETFFNELKIDLNDHEQINPFKVDIAEINTYPFYELNDFDKLRQAKEEKIPEEFKKMKEALMNYDV